MMLIFFFMKLSFISHFVNVLQTGASILLAVSGRTNGVSQNPVTLSDVVRRPCFRNDNNSTAVIYIIKEQTICSVC